MKWFDLNVQNGNPGSRNRGESARKRILRAARMTADNVLAAYNPGGGLDDDAVVERRARFGINRVSQGKRRSRALQLAQAFINPFTAVLFVLAMVSLGTDVFEAAPGERDFSTVVIILSMVGISGILRFVQEARADNAAQRLRAMVRSNCTVRRLGGEREIPMEDLVLGDIVRLSAGDMVPADVRIVRAKDLFVSQSALTGESEPVERYAAPCGLVQRPENTALALMGGNIVSGSADAVVVAVGPDTALGAMASALSGVREATGFEKGVNSVSWVFIRFMLVMAPVVLMLNGFTKGNWQASFLFALSVAVGLTPEMLPMIVTTCLAKGAMFMSRKKTIVKRLDSIQNFGAMDVLCTDKTGTLTLDRVILELHMDVHGKEDARVLRHAFLNSFHQTGMRNLMDIAIIERTRELSAGEPSLGGLEQIYRKVDEIPFDFGRRRMSVVVTDPSGKTQMITKGAVEEMLAVSSRVEFEGRVEPLTDALREEVLGTVRRFNDAGLRVIAVAQKNNPSPQGTFSVDDESEMVLIGYLAFLDPPKPTAAAAIAALAARGVAVKVLTGDNERVALSICRHVGLDAKQAVLGADIECMGEPQLRAAVRESCLFAKLTPSQKARVVSALRADGHTVGFMGDGINDAAAMRAADVGISVDTAVDVAKESADIILLEKDLGVLESGIVEGRRTYANMIKYIKMTASSNFGNMFSVLVASAFLPFLPMLSIQLLLLNLIYDMSCTSLPWDNVDAEYLEKPRKWNAGSIARFMLWMGPASSVFDIATYALMFFWVCPSVCGGQPFSKITDPATSALFIAVFQAGWFVESMCTQALVIHVVRTPKTPFVDSRASRLVTCLTAGAVIVVTAIPFTLLGRQIGLAALPASYFLWLCLIVVLYLGLTQRVKRAYIRRFGEWL